MYWDKIYNGLPNVMHSLAVVSNELAVYTCLISRSWLFSLDFQSDYFEKLTRYIM